MIHSEIMFLELIKLFKEISDDDYLNLDYLEQAFYILEELIENQYHIVLEYEFYYEWKKFYKSVAVIENNKLLSLDDNFLESLEDEVLLTLEDEDLTLDGHITELVHHIRIYKALNVQPHYEKYEDIFNLCFTIMQNYLMLAYLDANEPSRYFAISFIQQLVNQYDSEYARFHLEDISKLRVILSEFDDQYLIDEEEDFINESWYIILFSGNESQFSSLNYKRLWNSISEEYGLPFLLNNENNFIYLSDEIKFFLNYFTIYLNHYLNTLENSNWKNILNLKKYLLIAIQPSLEEQFLKHHTIDFLPIPLIKVENITENTFSCLYRTTMHCTKEFHRKDTLIAEEDYAHMIICAIFIRCFLDLTINQEFLDDIHSSIINSDFYKSKDYRIATDLIDTIIFKEKGLDLSKNFNK